MSAYVEEARNWARELVRNEARFPGDYGPAMKRMARKAGVPFGAVWSLHYRTPQTIGVEVYVALGAYYGEQHRKYREERAETQPRTALGRALLRAADALAGEEVLK